LLEYRHGLLDDDRHEYEKPGKNSLTIGGRHAIFWASWRRHAPENNLPSSSRDLALDNSAVDPGHTHSSIAMRQLGWRHVVMPKSRTWAITIYGVCAMGDLIGAYVAEAGEYVLVQEQGFETSEVAHARLSRRRFL
jgi:hypothetical protein